MASLTTVQSDGNKGLDEKKPNIREQATFAGTSKCELFAPNFLRADKCTNCYKNIFTHTSEAVKEDNFVMKALEWTAKGEKEGSTILRPEGGLGGLFLGGFRSTFSQKVLAKNNVNLIVNTAKGIGMFWPAYKRTMVKNKENGIEYHSVEWIDSESQVIEKDVLALAIQRIHQTRMEGKGVLVHCAQGKSRSSTLVIVYLCSLFKWSVEKATECVKSKRSMAQPNKGFVAQLLQFEKEKAFEPFLPNTILPVS